ncbi:hypothetical protein [Limnohabitans sp. TS-CS-82]|uniref:hypothetical protein n=1 Tax=Limnohabitans sp. TS-CS-82 TaxID=2094193 RepID=UPI0011B073EC|nr:hypothetical protein [Limnohabitans sp. TS-CS-82]
MKRSGRNRNTNPRISCLAEYVRLLGDKSMSKDTQRKFIAAHHGEWTEITADALMEMVKGLNPRKPD